MQPHVHAQASARQSGQDWHDDLPIHEFMDLAKHACPDLRHRLLLHNSDLGPELAAMAFSSRSDARKVALLHVQQDLGWCPPLEAWLQNVDPNRLPRSRKNAQPAAEIIRMAADYYMLAASEPVQMVWDMLMLPIQFAPKYAQTAAMLFMNSLGPILARAIFGPPRYFPRRDGQETIVDFSWVAEGMIVAHVGTMHSLERVLQGFDGLEPKPAGADG